MYSGDKGTKSLPLHPITFHILWTKVLFHPQLIKVYPQPLKVIHSY